MTHQVFLNPNNIIEIHLVGDITPEDMAYLGKEVIRLSTDVDKQGLPIKLLADYTKAGLTQTLVVTLAKSLLKAIQIDRMATYGTDALTTKTIAEVLESGDYKEKIKLFNTRAEAEAWLAS